MCPAVPTIMDFIAVVEFMEGKFRCRKIGKTPAWTGS
jgi:hypothetical protein